MKRRAVFAALFAIAAAGLVVAVLTRTNDPTAQASSVDGVVAQVRTSFGDNRIVRAGVHGSTLDVALANASGEGQTKSAFEAQVLAAAVAEWMRLYGQKPIAAFRFADRQGEVLSGTYPPLDGVPVPSNAGTSSLRPGACRSAAEASARELSPPLKLVSVEELPYLHGTCVIRLQATEAAVIASNASAAVLGRIVRGIGDPDDRPYYFELDGPAGRPLEAASWMPKLNGSTWARPGFRYAMAHG